jgi:hypothetical protein
MALEYQSPQWNAISRFAHHACDKEAKEGFDSLSELERTFFCVWVADGAVCNGGMHSVCYNSTGDYLQHFANAFESIGAPKKGQTFIRLATIFAPDGPSLNHVQRLAQHDALSPSKKDQISALDDAYESTGEAVDELLFHLLLSRGQQVSVA